MQRNVKTEDETAPSPITVQALLFQVRRAENGVTPTLKFMVGNGSTEFGRTNSQVCGIGPRFIHEMESMGRQGDVVMISKDGLLAILKALQDKDSSGVMIEGCNGNLIRTDSSPFNLKNVGKLVTFG